MSSNKKLKDLLGNGANRYNLIRLDARTRIRNNNDRIKKCEKCGYDKHVEICHIKAINSFDLETSLDIINNNDNLIILCPNCHWELDNLNNLNKERYVCPLCGGKKWKTANNCRKCTNKHKLHIRTRKVIWPTKEELEKLVSEIPLIHIGKKYGVEGNTVKKWCKHYDINLGNRLGFWSKKRCKQNKLVDSE